MDNCWALILAVVRGLVVIDVGLKLECCSVDSAHKFKIFDDAQLSQQLTNNGPQIGS